MIVKENYENIFFIKQQDLQQKQLNGKCLVRVIWE